jgi:hypothetical protein
LGREARKVLARKNSDDFCEFVLKDEKGNCVRQAEIHKEINWHIDECRRQKRNCGILAPWGHGKTEQVVIGRSLQLIGEDANNRIFIVCNSDDNAKARVTAISKYIEKDKDFKAVHPHIKAADKEEWSKHKLIVDRQSRSKDGSIEAWGIGTSGTGSRCDFMIFDDPVDLRNAILNPALRPQIKDCFYNVWSSRVSPNGFKIYIATIWHNDDLTSELLKNTEWSFLVMKISEDFNCIECESPFKGKYTIPLWSAAWSKTKLMSRLKEIGLRAFNRGYRQCALSDDDRTFPSYLSVFQYGVRISDLVRPEWPRVGGVDPFGKQVVIFTLALSPEGKRYPVEIRRGKWDPTTTINQIRDAYETHRWQMVVVENNAAQQAIAQWALEKGYASMPLMPFTTGAQKADPSIGLPGMEVEFSNGSWICAMGDRSHEPDCTCGLCVWKRELGSHPVAEAADTVMASWFAREAARALTLGIKREEAPADNHEVIVAEDMGLERVNIGGYDE